MTDSFPEPLVPADVDLRGMPFMPLYIDRLQKSKAWLLCKRRPELAFYLMNLWMRSWQEVPAASLEDDDDVLADAAMVDHKTWSKVRTDALRGWVKCSDGRLYHPVVAELALEAWGQRQAYRERTAKARQARQRRRNGHATDDVTDNDTSSVTEPVTALKGEGEGEGERQRKESPPNPLGEGEPVSDGEFERWYAAYPRHVGRGHALKAYRSARKKADAAILLTAAEQFAGAIAGKDPGFIPHPATWLNGERWLDQDTAGPQCDLLAGRREDDPETARWRVRLQGWQERGFWSLNWGEPPDSPYCHAPKNLLREIRELVQ